MAILEVNHIEKHFGKTKVLKDVSFSMEEGSAIAIIGSSGSGKTTLLRCLNFLEKPNQGTIKVRDEILFDAKNAATDKDADLLDSGSWFKIPHPVFSENREAGIYGPSAPVLVKSPDGECTYLMYSAAVTEKSPHRRSIYMQPISFSSEGNPEFGKPVPRNVRLPRVSSGNPRTW